ncbi:MAG: ABC transporter ATP-binding protein/permease [Cyanobacteria bacterium SZAS LIN-3]|nr:ABC transporter ATP-binding protein/permease [Cyanobacteria bacterium SZAS LIN-3]MBS2010856.1 ABC transporter ATP-binding protein/permease [Cyanobacteria bacterium SZAS TMP-1]
MQNIPGRHPSLFKRFCAIAKPFWVSHLRWKARALLAGVVALLIGSIFLNVVNAFVMGKFMTAMQARDIPLFYRYLALYAGVIIAGTPVVVFYGYLRTKLALVWRSWLTADLTSRYLSKLAYYKLAADPEIDNPDERITQDVDTFCNMTVGLSISVCDALFTIFSFAGVLWSMSIPLTFGVVLYAILGSVVSFWIGKKLIPLNFQHVKAEADLRYSVADVRRDFESIAFYRGEKRVKLQILRNLSVAMRNLNGIMNVNRNMGFFTHGYYSLVPIIPLAIVAPLYFAYHMEFGDLTRASIAFGNIFAGMSLLVSQFGALSAFAANITRLGSFIEALQKYTAPPVEGANVIELVPAEYLAAEMVSVSTPDGSRSLVNDLNFRVDPGSSLMIMGPSGAGKSSILRALAGIWTVGSGRVYRPDPGETMFLPQRPHVPSSTLRTALCYPRTMTCATDSHLLALLQLVKLEELHERYGLDSEQNWRDVLSLGQQQKLSFARLLLHRPKYAILDEATSALDDDSERNLYQVLKATGTTLVSVGHRKSLLAHHERLLSIAGDGSWTLSETRE